MVPRHSARDSDGGVTSGSAAPPDESSHGDEAVIERGLGTQIARIFDEIGIDFSDVEIPEFNDKDRDPVLFDD